MKIFKVAIVATCFVSLFGCASGLNKRVETLENEFQTIHTNHEEFRKVVNNNALILENIAVWINKIVERGDRIEEMEDLVSYMNKKLSHIKFIRMPNGKYFIDVEGQPVVN